MAINESRREDEIISPIMAGSAAELIQQGAIVMRVENDSLMAAAIARPRRLQDVLRRALEELELDPEEAHNARYSLPFKNRGEGGDEITRVEGLSINAAMNLARCFGNCSCTARILNEDAEGINLAGIFIDMETGFRIERPARASKRFRLRTGKVITLGPDRMRMALQAEASKGLRNAVLAGLPSGLKSAYERKAILVASGGDPDAKADEETLTKVLAGFAKRWSLTTEQIEVYLGRMHNEDETVPMKAAEWRGRHIADLRALFTSLRDGQIKIEDVLGVPDKDPDERVVVRPDSLTSEKIIAGTTTGRDDAPAGSTAPTREEQQAKDAAIHVPAPVTDDPKTLTLGNF